MQPSLQEKAQLDDTRRALLNMLEDTEVARRQAEENRKKIQLVITNLVDGLLVFGEEGRLELVNPQAERMFGVEGAAILEKDFEGLALLPALSELFTVLRAKREERLFRKEFVAGQAVLEVTELPLEQGSMLVLHDITREKAIERMKTEFVSLVAHQLRTPLSAIKWSLRMLLEGDAGEVPAQQKELLSRTYESNERMIMLIKDLLNVTRVESGQYFYQPSFVQIEDIIEAQIQMYRKEAAKKGVALTFLRPQKKCPKVLVDPEKIGMVVQNLLDNALHYTLQGGEVTVSVTHDAKELRVQVEDTGLGIPKKEQARIFERFFRASNATKVYTEGSGLGLYITRHIVEIHGGKIWFESVESKGTTFTFTLPIQEEMAEFLKKL